MTKYDIEERRLRRLEKRIRHLEAMLRLTAIFGGPARKRTENRVRDLWLRESASLWEMMHPDGEPEDQARKESRTGSRSGCGKTGDK